MTLKNIGPIEGLFGRGPRSGTETANHGPFVMGQGVPILVVLARETFDVVFARKNRAFLGSL